jgi:hypothetical protein
VIRRAALLASALAFLAACGGGGAADGGLRDSLAYLPDTASAVVVVSTDLESEQFAALDRIVRERTGRSAESFLRDAVEDQGLSWEQEIKPLLGREFVAGSVTSLVGGFGDMVAVLHTTDGDKLRAVLEKHYKRVGDADGTPIYRDPEAELVLAADGDRLVSADDELHLRRALERPQEAGHLTEARLRSVLGDLPDDALAHAYADVGTLSALPQVSRLRTVPWFDALRTVGFALSFHGRRAVLDFTLNTDRTRLRERDLPLATGREAAEVLQRPDQLVGGNRNQSLTTAFLYRVAEAALPDSHFVREVHALERELHVDFVQEVLRQFNGPSASAVSVDGRTFAARSEVRDPAALKALLPRLAPHLPAVVEALQGLQGEGQALLFLFAPDALVLRSSHVTVSRAGELWRVSGLTGEGPDELYFGVLGQVFVVASEARLAHRVATEPTVPVPGARGAGVLRVDLTRSGDAASRRLGIGLGRLGEVVAWLQASRARLRGQVSVELR